jgi:regulator of nucleoside diphosphate kinase
MIRHDQQPPIVISEAEHARLSDLAEANRHLPGVADYLLTELERASIAPDDALGAGFVAMNTELEYRDESTGATRRVTLVYPEAQDIAAWKISVLTPVGAALIGLAAGQTIAFEDRTGETRRLTVTRIFGRGT